MIRLNVLDQSPISEGSTGADALRNTIDLARHVDGLGYHRYWVAEHHGTSMLAGSSPEALIGPIAAATSSLRVGSGGVMLPYYNALKVAETFSVLSGLFPGRIDLGVGRAPGSDRETMLALQRDRTQPLPDDSPDQLAELLALLGDRFPAGHPLARQVHTLSDRRESVPGRVRHPPRQPWLESKEGVNLSRAQARFTRWSPPHGGLHSFPGRWRPRSSSPRPRPRRHPHGRQFLLARRWQGRT